MPQVYCQTALWFIIDHNHGPQLLWDRGTHIWTGGGHYHYHGSASRPCWGTSVPQTSAVSPNHGNRSMPMITTPVLGGMLK